MMRGDVYLSIEEFNKLQPEALIEDTSAGWGEKSSLSEEEKKDPEYLSALANAASTLEKIKAAVARSAIKPDMNAPK